MCCSFLYANNIYIVYTVRAVVKQIGVRPVVYSKSWFDYCNLTEVSNI